MVDYNAVHKDKCLTEFLRLKDCYLVYLNRDYFEYLLLIIRIGGC